MVAQLGLLTSAWLGDIRFNNVLHARACGPFLCVYSSCSSVSCPVLRWRRAMTSLVATRVRFCEARPFFWVMREFLLGVVGSGLTYAVLWYQMTPVTDVVRAAPA